MGGSLISFDKFGNCELNSIVISVGNKLFSFLSFCSVLEGCELDLGVDRLTNLSGGRSLRFSRIWGDNFE